MPGPQIPRANLITINIIANFTELEKYLKEKIHSYAA